MKEKVLWIINIALVLTAVFLLLHFLEIELPTLGKAQYWLDKSEMVCMGRFGNNTVLLDMSSCCSGLQEQLRCEAWEKQVLVEGQELKVNKRCYTGKGTVDYLVNMKAYNYCKKEGYLGYRVI